MRWLLLPKVNRDDQQEEVVFIWSDWQVRGRDDWWRVMHRSSCEVTTRDQATAFRFAVALIDMAKRARRRRAGAA
jgi:hypothetical protein